MALLKNKLVWALASATLVGVVSAVLTFHVAATPAAQQTTAIIATATGAPPTATARPPTATATIGAIAPTATPIDIAPTATPILISPTTTPTPFSKSGAVTSVDVAANSFALSSNGTTYTMHVTTTTTYSGGASSLATLQPSQQATVKGSVVGDVYTAASVAVSTDS